MRFSNVGLTRKNFPPQLDAEPERRGGVKIAVWSAAACVTVLLAACGVWFGVRETESSTRNGKQPVIETAEVVAAAEPTAPTMSAETEEDRTQFCKLMAEVPNNLWK